MNAFFALLMRDLTLAVRTGGGAFLAIAFFVTVAVLTPFGVGADLVLLARVAGGILWVAAMLAALLALDRLFQADYEDGSLDLLTLSPMPLEAVALAKITAHWLTTGAPLALLSPIMALLFGLPEKAFGALFISLLIGTPAVSALGSIGAALTLAIRRGGILLPLLILPLLAPVVIFGAGVVTGALYGLQNGALPFLAAFSAVSVLVAPFVAAAGVRFNLAG